MPSEYYDDKMPEPKDDRDGASRADAEKALRDIAFVLKMTQKVKSQILRDASRYKHGPHDIRDIPKRSLFANAAAI